VPDEREFLEVVTVLGLEFAGRRAHFLGIEMPEPVPATSRASGCRNVAPA